MSEDENKNDETKKAAAGNPVTEEALPEGHQPDLGTPENQNTQEPAASDEEKYRREAAEWKDKYFRLYAEFDNFRKRTQRERVDLLASASGDTIRELLPVIDDFERAIRANESIEDISAVKEGFALIHQKFYRKLEAAGLRPIDSNGQTFDVDFHEAITEIPAPSPEMKGKVVDTVEKGYTLNEKVLRFAKVVVGA